MNKSWKTFIIIISVLLCTAVVCITVNVAIGSITKNIAPSGIDGTQNGSGQLATDTQGNNMTNAQGNVIDAQGNAVAGTVTATDAQGNVVVQNPSSANGNSGAASAGTVTPGATVNPLNYSKAQLVAYYNTCLKKSYSQPKMVDTKTEKISVGFDDQGVSVNGKPQSGITSIANMIVKANAKDTNHNPVTFTNGNSSEGSATAYVLPANLSSNGVRNATIAKSGSGYKMVITLVQESCDFKTMPPHNKACAWPLNFNDIDFMGYAEITSATFNYPGTKLTINIDGNGRVTFVQVNMPLSVKNASGTLLKISKGTIISVSEISGEWVCKNTMTF